MAKFKLNLSAFDLHSASSWVGAFVLAVFTIGSVYGAMQYFADKFNARQVADPDPKNRALVYESAPINTVPESVDFTNLAPSTQMIATETPVVTTVKGNPYRLWNYVGESGPKFWSLLSPDFKLCSKGKEQSPIALESSGSKSNNRISTLRYAYDPIAGELSNDGRLLRFDAERGDTLLAFNQTYSLEFIQIHIPGEHLVDGKKFDAELQFHHKGSNGTSLIMSVLATEATANHIELQRLLKNIPSSRDRPIAIEALNVERFLPGGEEFFYYDGSVTQPPCTESVKWIVLKSPIAISAQQIDRMLAVTKFNARPVQNVAGRNVYRSW